MWPLATPATKNRTHPESKTAGQHTQQRDHVGKGLRRGVAIGHMATPTGTTTMATQKEDNMSATRPERIDRHGLRHRHGCPADRITDEPAATRPGWRVIRCRSCKAIHVTKAATNNPEES